MSEAHSTLTYERLKELLSYDEKTGIFIRIKHSSRFATRSKLFEPVGTKDSKGHIQIRLDGKLHLAHRLAIFYTTGNIPNCDIDHKDGNRSNNSISNLRVGSHKQNMQNRRAASCKSETGFLGVSLTTSKKYQARITADEKDIYLGSFETAEEAHKAYLKAKRELHEFCTI